MTPPTKNEPLTPGEVAKGIAGLLVLLGFLAVVGAGLWYVWASPDFSTQSALAMTGVAVALAGVMLGLAAEEFS